MKLIMIYHFFEKEWKMKDEKLVTNLHDKTEYVIHIRNLIQALKHELVFEKVHKVIKFNRNARLKSWYGHRSKIKDKKWFGKRFY